MSLGADNSAPAIITDYPFTPRSEWWSLCATCQMGEAAHEHSTPRAVEDQPPYRCPNCVTTDQPACSHRERADFGQHGFPTR